MFLGFAPTSVGASSLDVRQAAPAAGGKSPLRFAGREPIQHAILTFRDCAVGDTPTASATARRRLCGEAKRRGRVAPGV